MLGKGRSRSGPSRCCPSPGGGQHLSGPPRPGRGGAPEPLSSLPQEAMCRLNSTHVLAQVLGQGRTGFQVPLAGSLRHPPPPSLLGQGPGGGGANTRGPLLVQLWVKWFL